MSYQWPEVFASVMRNFLLPRSIAVIGASDDTRYGRRMLENLLSPGSPVRVFPVNPKRAEIMGVKCYPSVLDIDEKIDLAAILIPARVVLSVMKQCAEKGIRSVIIISAGFSERDGQAGLLRQKELCEFADKHDIYICGPNCLGISNVKEKFHPNSSPNIAEVMPVGGPIGVVSQSGATAFGPLLMKAKDRGVPVNYIVSTGNEANLDSADFIRYMLDDPDIRVIATFIEGFKNGDKVKAVADLALENKKPIVIMKMGRSDIGTQAALTHTASIAGSFKTHDGFFRQKGILRVDDYDELCETASSCAQGKFPRGNRVGVISHSGGICTFISDECAAAGFDVPDLSKPTTTRIAQILEGWGSCRNPLDLTGYAQGRDFPEILTRVINDDTVDAVILATRGSRQYVQDVATVARQTEKPLLFIWTDTESDIEGLQELRKAGVPTFLSPVKCVRALRHLRNYSKMIHRQSILEKAFQGSPRCSEECIEKVRDVLSQEACLMTGEGRSRQILSPFNLPFASSILCQTPDDAKTAARQLGYPIVMKIDSPEICHKTECEGVYLDVKGEEELTHAFASMVSHCRSMTPQPSLNGIMVQEMASGGIELILGVSEDPLFGPVLMLGWGGIFVEALDQNAWRVCPINRYDAQDMIGEIPGLDNVLGGIRGQGPLDKQGLIDLMVDISIIADSLQSMIASLDFNPLIVLPEGQGIKLLDCRIHLRADKTAR
jgi:acetyltransferase